MTAALFSSRPCPPAAAGAGVRRSRLVTPLADPCDAPPFAVLVAPAGFGKTTLLCEWSARDPRPFAWVTLTAATTIRTLLRSVAAAVDAATADAADGRVVLVLDDAHRLHSAAAHETLTAIVTQLPAECRSRSRRAPSCRCRSRGCAPRAGDRAAPRASWP